MMCLRWAILTGVILLPFRKQLVFSRPRATCTEHDVLGKRITAPSWGSGRRRQSLLRATFQARPRLTVKDELEKCPLRERNHS